jgi:hypothetical protein
MIVIITLSDKFVFWFGGSYEPESGSTENEKCKDAPSTGHFVVPYYCLYCTVQYSRMQIAVADLLLEKAILISLGEVSPAG